LSRASSSSSAARPLGASTCARAARIRADARRLAASWSPFKATCSTRTTKWTTLKPSCG
jgi:hypothetical protein